MSKKQGIELAHKQGIDFTMDEADIIVPFLKQNAFIVNHQHEKELVEKIKPQVSSTTLEKIKRLLKSLEKY